MAYIIPISKLTLKDFIERPSRYAGLAEGLMQLPAPEAIRIRRRQYEVPADLRAFASQITYGQRHFFNVPETMDASIILRFVAGFYYPIATRKPWNDTEALKFGRYVLNSLIKDLYPTAWHFLGLMQQLVTREQKLLHRKPTHQEQQAGIERLNKYADLVALLYLQDSFKCTAEEVMLKPYDECLVRFKLKHEQDAYAERLQAVYKRESEMKSKTKP